MSIGLRRGVGRHDGWRCWCGIVGGGGEGGRGELVVRVIFAVGDFLAGELVAADGREGAIDGGDDGGSLTG